MNTHTNTNTNIEPQDTVASATGAAERLAFATQYDRWIETKAKMAREWQAIVDARKISSSVGGAK